MQSGDRKETKQARNSRETWFCSQLCESPRPGLTEEAEGKAQGIHITCHSTDHCVPVTNATTFAFRKQHINSKSNRKPEVIMEPH